MANATMSKDEILDAIGSMSVLELSELRQLVAPVLVWLRRLKSRPSSRSL